MKCKTLFLFLLVCCMSLAGCAPKTQAPVSSFAEPGAFQSTSQSAPDRSEVPAVSDVPNIPDASDALDGADSSVEAGSAAALYIGTKDRGFQEYPINYDGELTPELLIQSIADLTGWDLTLAEEVYSGKGGMSVCLSSQSALFVGPPDPQNEEFFVYDSCQFSRTVLDSIQKTLQMGFTGPLGDPDALDIYFFLEGNQPLELPDLGLSWPLDQPYAWPED